MQIVLPRLFQALVVVLFSGMSARCYGALDIPKGLDRSDREQLLRIVGFGTATKLLSQPWPLGGYQGLELGASLESVDTEQVSRLGSKLSSPQSDMTVTKLSMGKGFFNDFDFWLQITPYSAQTQFSSQGVLVRWAAWRSDRLPIVTSVIVHANNSAFGNQLTLNCYGSDVLAGIQVAPVGFYGGFGFAEVTGRFMGGTDGTTASGEFENEYARSGHVFAGISLGWESLFASAQIDRYTFTTYAGRIGFRF